VENEWLERETLGKERLGLQVKIVVRVKCRVVARMEDERNQDCEAAELWEIHSNKNGR